MPDSVKEPLPAGTMAQEPGLISPALIDKLEPFIKDLPAEKQYARPLKIARQS